MSLPDKKDICEKIVKIASNSGSYIEAVVHVADQENIEVESIAKFLTKPLKEKIEIEARELNIMRNRKSKLKFG
jgi:hypothetical protein|tara:strand:+ start:271 stop:492 length:222 start_codon:yes stop_codon:yes gene_type:complete